MIVDHYIPTTHDPKTAQQVFSFFDGAAFSDQRVRYLKTWDLIARNLDLSGKTVAETGHLSGLSEYYRSVGQPVAAIDGDFRYRMDAEDASADILFSFEVFEHIKDQDHKHFDDLVLFNFTGVRAFAAEMHRVLRPGGQLVLTTPNACSLINAFKLCNNEPPWLYWPHVREYSSKEVIEICGNAGFVLEFFDTMYAFHYLAPDFEHDLHKYIGSTGASIDHRGDDMFFVFRKPTEAGPQ
ncbi:methyltransferase domain-containing protein [Azospirillum doebereinerae]|uniref:Methyltransferase domain-containing protein n=2 Tax=Azospirillum doebereinerae TaxID=92933 RepID=A0A3S0V8I4_9PROT|nr:methyltransferase domain-containing protein [Azospirillum doebereinerae]